jgi:hypothetical protein
MKTILQFEELAQFILVIILLRLQPIALPWWLWPILFLAPDLGMLGYLHSPQVGAITYNLVHHKLIALLVVGIGFLTHQPVIVLSGLILYGHSSMDRMLGYGLKYPDSFKHTHLGWM